MRSQALEALQMAGVVLGSSALWYFFARRALRLPGKGFRPALARLLEWAGLTLAFYVADVLLGIVLTLGLRTTGFFVSMYGNTDVTLLLLAAAQAFVVRAWLD